jgi:hypothetical protein
MVEKLSHDPVENELDFSDHHHNRWEHPATKGTMSENDGRLDAATSGSYRNKAPSPLHDRTLSPRQTSPESSPYVTMRKTPSSQRGQPTRLHQSFNKSASLETNLSAESPADYRGIATLPPLPSSASQHKTKTLQRRPEILPITVAEYEASPRVVTMQVSLAQVHEAVLRLNQAWRADPNLSAVLTESQIASIWNTVTDRQRTKLLLSLCHWRRLDSSKQTETNPPQTLYSVVVPKHAAKV